MVLFAMMLAMEIKKYVPYAVGVIIVAVLVGGVTWFIARPNHDEKIRESVTLFGQRLKNVPLAADSDEIVRSIDVEYAAVVTPELLETWKNNPEDAPGREVSSPTPNRIEIIEIQKLGEAYLVVGDIVLTTSVQGEELRERILMVMEKREKVWLISDYTKQVAS